MYVDLSTELEIGSFGYNGMVDGEGADMTLLQSEHP